MSEQVRPFTVDISSDAIADLRERLGRTRWPNPEPVGDWSQGIPLAYTAELCRYWQTDYDFAAAQARLNAFPQFMTEIDGLDVHFLHARSPEPHALPLVLTHGWPGSIVEFLHVLGPLTDPAAHGGDPADAFHVVCPSLPGYGWSAKPSTVGWGIDHIGEAWIALMARLGYDRYGAQGGDWGSMVTASVGRQDPEHVVGIHLNMPVAAPDPETFGDLTPVEQKALDDLARHQKDGTGYSKEQSTKPQTLGYGLADSPAGQCAWVVEKFYEWTDNDGHPESAVARDALLDNVLVYWLTNSGASSARLYWESYARSNMDPIGVAMGASIFPKEIIKMSQRWAAKRFTDIRYWNELERGGHFAALEQPEIFVNEVRSFFRLVR
ncbi:MAG TPA: epoxide hydrolase [Frankiaceae bacterium]|jgi:pimeloyl-ACP methyl ester carboxylesterase|nr:epoxide hydrolase [Frankiaceae bacterium]